MIIDAEYFDGKTSQKQQASIEFSKDFTITLKTDEISCRYSLEQISISSRVANTPRIIKFPNNAVAYSNENDKIDAILKELKGTNSLVHLFESKMRYAFFALILLIASVVFFLTIGSSITAKYIAKITPQSIEDTISHQTLKTLDKYLLKPTKLDIKEQEKLKTLFTKLTNNQSKYNLHFRRGIGINAFALPSGDIVLSDELVKFSDGEDRMIYGVLAHEVGHVEYKHSMQLIVKASIVSAIVTYFTGDVSSIVASVSATLLNANYSREFESEADNYAKLQMKKANISPKYLADFFIKMNKLTSTNDKEHSYFDSHPSNQERIDNLLN